MAGNWIKWCKGLADRREVRCIASTLGRDRYEIAGRLMKLWEWCDDNFSDQDINEHHDVSLFIGDNPGTEIDETTGVPGFAAAMCDPKVDWLRITGDGMVTFPNLARHNGSSSKQRVTATEKKRKQRGVSPNCPQLSGTETGTDRGPEKRREDKNKEIGAPAAEPPVEEFPSEHPWMTRYRADSLVFESWLVKTWATFHGVSRYGKAALETTDKAALIECLHDPTWPIDAAFAELAAHGISFSSGFKPDLSWMFKPGNARKVAKGDYRSKFVDQRKPSDPTPHQATRIRATRSAEPAP